MVALALSTSRHVRNPARPQQWNASITSGDDVSLALSVYDDDVGTVTDVSGASSVLALFAEAHRVFPGVECDYGWGWWTLNRKPEVLVNGIYSAASPGQLAFGLPAATTATLWGRYRMIMRIDNFDGISSQVQGILEVRRGFVVPMLYSGPFSPDDFDAEFTGGEAA